MILGTVEALWRYPVKSLRGESLGRARLTQRGLEGDRAFAMRERSTGRIVSGKRFEGVLAARAASMEAGVAVTLPGGTTVDAREAAPGLSALLGVGIEIVGRDGGDERVEISGEADDVFRGWPGSFFDSAPVHIVTSATLDHLRALHPSGDFDPRRFRPNIFVRVAGDGPVEQDWAGRTIEIGGARLDVIKGCRRCVMTTQAQDELPRDRDILRTVARETDGIVGVLCSVARAGEISIGDELRS